MAKRSSKPRDLNVLAASIVGQATDENRPQAAEASAPPPDPAKTGRVGGLKGGRTRANKLTPEQRSDSARRAAQARWQKKR